MSPVTETDIAAPAWDEALPGFPERIEALARAAFAATGLAERRPLAAIRLADDAEIAALNADWRGKSGPTNVLSFPSGALEDASGLPPDLGVLPLGDVVLAFETVAREARAQRKALGDHAAHLVLHGLLHLIGYDHGTDPEAREMEAMEVELLTRFGIADPYAARREDLAHG
ncbi:MAG: rRNA maturation RNase YbeY [Alphaproteobacteria bacterium]|nr:rRNA maturation RNase YbeY [Alphaproteobacteria bacterium]